MIFRRTRVTALALLLPIVVAACSSSPETAATATGAGGGATTASSTAGTGGAGGGSATTATSTVTATSSATTTTSATTSASSSGSGGAASCAAEIDADLATKTAGLLYLSESDYPFETVNLKDTQGGAITPAHLLDLLMMDPLLITETRTIPVFFDNLLNNSPDSAQYQMVLDMLQSTLTDLTVIRIIPAAPHSAEVQVYIIGRTTCGEIAGLKTVSIET